MIVVTAPSRNALINSGPVVPRGRTIAVPSVYVVKMPKISG